jgi:large subunit ribosomal protein L4e
MQSARPLVRVFDASDATSTAAQVPLPGVFTAPIRQDVVHAVHSGIAKNARQAYAVKHHAGQEHSALSWGTGRAVSRIPRIQGSGSHAMGAGAFGNMCRGGRMFAPTKVWRKWHQKVNVNQRRFAVASALAASALPALVMARGHRIGRVPEMPLVVSNAAESTAKTAQAVALLERFGAGEDLARVRASRQVRKGRGKLRNRRHTQRRGPLVVHAADDGLARAMRNIPGVELANVDRLNLLQLAPGGHLGRFIVWTQGAFERLDALYGSYRKGSALKKGYRLPRSKMSNPDLARIINSDEVQSVVRPARVTTRFVRHRKNPLVNNTQLFKLNPFAKVAKRAGAVEQLRAEKRKAGTLKYKGTATKMTKARKAKATERRAAKMANFKVMTA